MRRLAPLDRALLLILVPLWSLAFALHLDALARGRLAWVPLVVTAPQNEHEYPIAREASGPAQGWDAGDVRVGDHILRLGDADLRGVGQRGFIARALEAAGPDLRVPLSLRRGTEPVEGWLNLRPMGFGWRFSILTLPFVVLAAFLVLRLPGSPLARAIFLACMAHAFHWTPFHGGPRAQTYAWLAVFCISVALMYPLTLRVALIFPEPRGDARTRLPAWLWLFAIIGPMVTSWLLGVPVAPAVVVPAVYLVNAAFALTLVALITRAFVRADPIGRRQLKWVLYGAYVSLGPVVAVDLLGTYLPWRAREIASIAIALLPVCGFIAIVRFDFLDIDRLISTTAAYSVLSVLALAGALLLIPRLSLAVATTGAVDPVVGQSILSLLLAALLVPGQRWVRPQIERLFFAERHALERGVQHLLRDLATCDGPQALFTLVGERLGALLRPESCVLYGKAGDAYVPVYARGRVVPPSVEAQSTLVRALEAREAPMDVERSRQRRGTELLDPADRAALDSLAAAIVVPVGGQESLAAFVCIGEKRSGDVYTPTDLALLAAVAEKTSSELRRFDEAEIRDRARAMQEALRRYVPEPVAARVVSGQDVHVGEQEISVLFVDLRGYTTYSEDRTAAEIFSTVNRYTETVSRVIRMHGGTVVEFNGDGMMAVFGAPEPLACKERAAVEAGREVITAVRSLELGGTQPLDVSVGVATGQAFVGNIRSVDRWIWSAIGNTTNLAARLQSLTRELRAAMAVDRATWSAAGTVAAAFERRQQVPIRGRRQTEDVYVLPLEAA